MTRVLAGLHISRTRRRHAAVTGRGHTEAPVKIIIMCQEALGLKRTVHVADGEPATRALMTAVKLARSEETVVTGRPRCDSKSIGLVERAHQFVQGLLRTWVPSIEKRQALWLESHAIRHFGSWD